jgi:hypothetical protein
MAEEAFPGQFQGVCMKGLIATMLLENLGVGLAGCVIPSRARAQPAHIF